MKRLRSLSAQLLLLIILPLFLLLATVAIGSVAIHQSSMRDMVGERDLRAVRTAAVSLSSITSATSPHAVDILRELEMSPDTVVVLVGKDRRILYSSDSSQIGQFSSNPGVAEALGGRSGMIYRTDTPDGAEHVVAYAPVVPGGWALVVEEPWREMASPWLSTSLIGPLVLLPTAALALAALWLGVRRIMRPLQKLDAEVTALGWGDFDAVSVPVGGIQEIQELQRAIVRMAGQIRAYQQSMHDYVGAVTTAQEEERNRLARELHDDTIQNLIALKQRVQSARRKVGQDPAGVEKQLSELQALLETTMEDVRRFSRDLRPIYLEEAGLVSALEALTRDISRDGVPAALEVAGEVWRLPPDTELALYRMVQESLNNVVRHAGATRARVKVDFADHHVAIHVEDNGTGFDMPSRVTELAETGHYGLMGMHERAQLVGARLQVRSQPGLGTTIEIDCPG
jgi:signal transduction histidine kinase